MSFIQRVSQFAVLLLVGIVFLGHGTQLSAQSRFSTRPFLKSHTNVKKVFAPLVEKLGDSTVLISVDGKERCLGTVVDAKGLIVTKASEIEDKQQQLVCKVQDRTFKPTLVATDSRLDLALLRVPAGDRPLKPVQFSIQPKVESGQFVVSVDHDSTPEAIGVVTVRPRQFSNRFGRRVPRNQGYLGVESEANPDGKGVLVGVVAKDTAAEKSGLRPGDIILSIEGDTTDSQSQLSLAIKKHSPGTTIKVKTLRRDKEIERSAKLGNFREVIEKQNFDQWGGGRFNRRRFEFGTVIAHDTVISPEKVGGPLVNLDGQVIGINIARALRVTTYALPAQQVMDFVKQNRSLNTSNPSSNPETSR